MNATFDDRVAAIKARHTVRTIAAMHGIDLPARCGQKFPSPIRPDANPSCELWLGHSGEELVVDRTTGERLDCIGLAAAIRGVTRRDVILSLFDGMDCPTPIYRARPILRPAPPPRTAPRLPPLRLGSLPELRQLSELRGIPLVGLDFAQMLGLLRFCSLRGQTSWMVTDSAALNAQARRLDGRAWDHLPGAPKAWTLRGCIASHPLGLPTVEGKDFVLLVEGGPDLLAATAQIYAQGREGDTAAVALTGSSLRISATDRPTFAGTHVRIVPHLDPAGAKAMHRWAADLRAGGARLVDAFDLRGIAGKDLNDALRHSPEVLRDLIPTR